MNKPVSFYFDGHRGTVDRFGFVFWAGMGFQIEAAAPALRKVIDNAAQASA